MNPWTRRLVAAVLVLVAVAASFVASPKAAEAATSGCYASGCNGLDPTNRCDGDAQTVAAMAVTDGMLELRYSRSCKANWGRYTPYARTVSSLAAMKIGIWARVTVWNPGLPSYGSAHNANLNIYESSWSQMTNGIPTACTGVEITYVSVQDSGGIDYESIGWTWGPCY